MPFGKPLCEVSPMYFTSNKHTHILHTQIYTNRCTTHPGKHVFALLIYNQAQYCPIENSAALFNILTVLLLRLMHYYEHKRMYCPSSVTARLCPHVACFVSSSMFVLICLCAACLSCSILICTEQHETTKANRRVIIIIILRSSRGTHFF